MKTSLYPEPRRRELFPFVEKTIYLAASAETPLCTPAWEAVEGFFRRHRQEGMGCFGTTMVELQRCRERICQLLGADDPEDVALVPSTTAGATSVAHSLPLEPGDWVLSDDLEFPSNLWPFEDAALRAEACLVRLPTQEGRVTARQAREFVARRTGDWGRLRALAWSWVQYRDGYRVDLSELGALARDTGAFLAVDAIQGLGVVPFSLRETPVDAVYAGGHKWLLGMGGGGFLWVDRARIPELRGFGRGWLSALNPIAMDLTAPPREDARRFETGGVNFAAYYALGAGLDLLLGLGIQEIFHHTQHLQEHLLRALEGTPYRPASLQERPHRSAILALRCPHPDVPALVGALAERGILCTARDGLLRLAPHLYNTIEEMDTLAEVLRSLAA